LTAAFDINDRGEIVAGAQDPSCTDPDICDYSHAVLLIPCDEAHPRVQACDYSMVDTDKPHQFSMEQISTQALPLDPSPRIKGRYQPPIRLRGLR
jgi:hypothetical protein